MSTRVRIGAVAPARARIGPAGVVLTAFAPVAFVVYDPGGWYPFGPVKWLAVSVLGLGVVALVLERGVVRSRRTVTLAGGAFLGWAAIAAVFGQDDLYAWTGTPERHLGCATWLLCGLLLIAGQSLDRERDVPLVVGGVAVAGGLLGLAGVGQALGWDPVALDVDTDRLTATFGSAAYVGAAGTLALPVLVGVAADGRIRSRLRIAAAAGGGLLAIAIAGSGTRGAWVGLGAAAATTAWLHRRCLLAHRRAAAVMAAGALAGLGLALVASPVGDRVGDSFGADAGGGQGRLDEWEVAARVLARHPIIGVGPEGYRLAFAEGVDATYERRHGRNPLPDRTHNGLLDIAVTTGLPGLAAYLFVLIALGRFVLRALRRGRPWLIGTAAGLLGYAVQQQFLFPVAEVDPVAWLLAGALVVTVADRGELAALALPRPAPLAIGVAAAGALSLGALDVAADRKAATAADALSEGDPAVALAAADDAAGLRPDVVRYHLLASRAAVAAGQGDDALAAARDAVRVSPGDPIARRTYAELLVSRAGATNAPADVAAARTETARLVGHDPDNAELQLLAGLAAVHAGDTAAAEQAWLAAERLAPRSAAPATNLALLYLRDGRLPEAREAAEAAVGRDPDDARAQSALDQVSAAEASGS